MPRKFRKKLPLKINFLSLVAALPIIITYLTPLQRQQLACVCSAINSQLKKLPLNLINCKLTTGSLLRDNYKTKTPLIYSNIISATLSSSGITSLKLILNSSPSRLPNIKHLILNKGFFQRGDVSLP